MLYVCSDYGSVNSYWEKEFDLQYKVKLINYDDVKNSSIGLDDILILDIDFFNTNEDLIAFINDIPKTTKIIALIESPKLAHGAYIIKLGFKSYLGKKTSKVLIKQALNSVLSSNVWLYPELMNFIIKHIHVEQIENTTSEIFEKLSSKEVEVAKLVADGLSNKEIAKILDIQLVTVKKHMGSIFSKLNIKDRVSLAIMIKK